MLMGWIYFKCFFNFYLLVKFFFLRNVSAKLNSKVETLYFSSSQTGVLRGIVGANYIAFMKA